MFAYPAYLWTGLAAASALWLLSRWALKRKRKIARQLIPQSLAPSLEPPDLEAQNKLRMGLRHAACFLLVIAMAGPQWGVELATVTGSGIHAVLAIDSSASMAAEEGGLPRFARAQNALLHLIDLLEGNRVGLVAFSSTAHIWCPLTTDLAASKMFLHTLKVGSLPHAGTSLTPAIELAVRMLEKQAGTKAVVLLTDGEDRSGDVRKAAEEAQALDIHLYCLGIGNPQGEPIPVRNAQGKLLEYKKDARGETVLTRLDEKTLQAIAETTGGKYYRLTPGQSEVQALAEDLRSLSQNPFGKYTQRRYKNRYPIPLFLALTLLGFEMLIPESKRR
ncbi:MAG: VWA domain-containing protein [Elusimicrobia bacterium]|nr:VWA domain-containing protein [Elusimicrobiota bacterium]